MPRFVALAAPRLHKPLAGVLIGTILTAIAACSSQPAPTRPSNKGQAQMELTYEGGPFRFEKGEGELVETESERSLQVIGRYDGSFSGALNVQAAKETQLWVRGRFTGSDLQTTGSVSVKALDTAGKAQTPLLDDHATITLERLSERTPGTFDAAGKATGTDMFSGKPFSLTFTIGKP